MKKHLMLYLLSLIAGFFLGASYKNTKTETVSEFNPFVNDQVEVMFKSELEACNLKWSNSCGIGIERVNGVTYYTIDTKDMVDKGVRLYLE
jgi:hypothetical protein